MRILIAPQEFKGSLTARQAAAAIADGLRRALPDAELEPLLLADGGPGTVDALVEATAGQSFEADAHDPLGRPIRARWGALGDRRDDTARTAVIEMAAASGLSLLRPDELDPGRASTSGTGELLRTALDAKYPRIIIGVGGSATNDGGAGVAQALGARLVDKSGGELPPGGRPLALLSRIDAAELDPRLATTEVIVAADVTNPLCGPQGASLIYGPQKGATGGLDHELDIALTHYAAVVRRDLGVDIADTPSGGAGGGIVAGLIAFCGAKVRPGFDIVADAVGLTGRIRWADLVVTGEGRLDRQSAFGKTTAGVAHMARAANKPVIALAGSVDAGYQSEAEQLFDDVFTLTPELATPEEAVARAADLLSQAAEALGRRLADGP